MPAISVRNLGKRYRVNHAAPRDKYRTLRESLTDAATAPLRRLRNGGTSGTTEEFWALKDVNFDVEPGEVVGIIGRNGAGKSTLLKVLSRITEPTTGEIRLNGRIASLLEVGTGFHPELTGRENIYLNGSILGMSRCEIERSFDAIVDFSGVERFLDTPIKRYSSGMQVRLAFAVAAHLEPEVLVIDEVLAVGDVAFQQKCLARLEEVAHEGRTILFVSHNMAAVRALCSRGILVEKGGVLSDTDSSGAIEGYLGLVDQLAPSPGTACASLVSHSGRRAGSQPVLEALSVHVDGRKSADVPIGAALSFDVSFRLPGPKPGLAIAVVVCAPTGERVTMFHSRMHAHIQLEKETAGVATCSVPSLPLTPGQYRIDVAAGTHDDLLDYVENAIRLTVYESDFLGTGEIPSRHQGVVVLPAAWRVSDLSYHNR